MKLNECRKCKGLIAPYARICCHCGASDPLWKGKKRVVYILLCLLVAGAVFFFLER